MVAQRPRILRASFYALGLVVWVLSVSCVIEWLGGSSRTDQLFRATVKPLFRTFSGFGEIMAVATPIFAALAMAIRKKRQAVLCAATALIAWLVTFQCAQRAPIVGAAAGVALLAAGLIVWPGLRQGRNRRAGLMLAGFIFVAAPQFVTFSPNESEEGLLQRFQSTSLSESNTGARLLYWGVGWEMFRSHPLTGVGANNYQVTFAAARERFAAAHPDSALVGTE